MSGTLPVGRHWTDIAREAREHRDETIARVDPRLLSVRDLPQDVTAVPASHLDPEEKAITEETPESLLSRLNTGKLTSLAVTKAFLRRAAVAQMLVSHSSYSRSW